MPTVPNDEQIQELIGLMKMAMRHMIEFILEEHEITGRPLLEISAEMRRDHLPDLTRLIEKWCERNDVPDKFLSKVRGTVGSEIAHHVDLVMTETEARLRNRH